MKQYAFPQNGSTLEENKGATLWDYFAAHAPKCPDNWETPKHYRPERPLEPADPPQIALEIQQWRDADGRKNFASFIAEDEQWKQELFDEYLIEWNLWQDLMKIYLGQKEVWRQASWAINYADAMMKASELTRK